MPKKIPVALDDELDAFISDYERAERNLKTAREIHKDFKSRAVDMIGEGRVIRNKAGTFALQVTQPSTKIVVDEPSAKQILKDRGMEWGDFVDLRATIRDVPQAAYDEIADVLEAHGVDLDEGIVWDHHVREAALLAAVVDEDVATEEDLWEAGVRAGVMKEVPKSRPAIRPKFLGGGGA